MKNWFSYIVVIAIMMGSLNELSAQVRHDTIYFYNSWEQILYQQPDAFLQDPYIEMATPFEIYPYATVTEADKIIRKDYIAASMNGLWLINSAYLKKNFSGDVGKLDGFIPVYYNDKVAFITYVGYGQNLTVTQKLFGTIDEDIDYSNIYDIYYIDFMKKKVQKVTPEVLSNLLESYHDLQMRYEGMKNYNKREIIHDYFYKYVDRATEDFMRPFILDLTANHIE